MGINTVVQPLRTGTSIRDYVDELKLRLQRLDVVSISNTPLLVTLINQARREVQAKLSTLIPEYFGKIVNFNIPRQAAVFNVSMAPVSRMTNGSVQALEIPLPQDLLDVVAVLLRWSINGNTFESEARRHLLREVSSIGQHAFNVPTIHRPAYVADKQLRRQTTGSTFLGNYELYLMGLDTAQGQTLFDIADGNQINVEVWYTKIIDDLEWDGNALGTDFELVLPPHLQEYVLLTALLKAAQHYNVGNDMQTIMLSLQEWQSNLPEIYTVAKKQETSLLPSKEVI